MPNSRAFRAAALISSSSVMLSNAPTSPTSRRSIISPRIRAIPIVAAVTPVGFSVRARIQMDAARIAESLRPNA